MKNILLTLSSFIFLTACAVHTDEDGNNKTKDTPTEQELKISTDTTSLSNDISVFDHSSGDIVRYFSYSPAEDEQIYLASTMLGTLTSCGKGNVVMLIQELDVDNKVISSLDFEISQDYALEREGNYRVKVTIQDQPSCAVVAYSFTVKRTE